MSTDEKPLTVQVFARREDGTEVNVTEGVQVLYDTVVMSMDWGSGFLDTDEARSIIKIAQVCGYLTPEAAAEKFSSYAETISGDEKLTCITCGQTARFSFGYPPRDTSSIAGLNPKTAFHYEHPRGWHHLAGKADHPVQLWPVAAGVSGSPTGDGEQR